MRLLKIMFVALGLVVAGYAGAFLLWHGKIRHDVRSLRAQIQRDGYPTSLEQLQAWYVEPPAGQNAADVYQRAFQNNPALPPDDLRPVLPRVGDAEAPPPSEPLPEATVRAIEQYLQANTETLGLLHEAGKFEASRYPIDLTDGPDTELPHLAMLRHGANMLSLEALLHAHRGNPDAAVDDVVDILHIGRSIAQEPLLISQLVRIAINGIAELTLEDVLARTTLEERHLARLDEAFQRAEGDTRHFVRGLAGDRATAMSFFNLDPSEAVTRFASDSTEDDLLSGNALDAFYTVTGLFAYGHRWYLRHMNQLVSAAEGPVEEQAAWVDKLAEAADDASDQFNLGKPLFEAFSRSLWANGRDVVFHRAVRTALAVERYRQRHGRLPARLEDLVPGQLDAVATDPFSGEPLKYRLRERGYVVYSVHADREDDGGLDIAEGTEQGLDSLEADVGFVMAR